MKCLEKDRNRRYETASALAADVEHYLADESVQACPPSVLYRIRKFARRNKLAIIAGSLLAAMLLMIMGVVGGSLGWIARDRGSTGKVAPPIRPVSISAGQLLRSGLGLSRGHSIGIRRGFFGGGFFAFLPGDCPG